MPESKIETTFLGSYAISHGGLRCSAGVVFSGDWRYASVLGWTKHHIDRIGPYIRLITLISRLLSVPNPGSKSFWQSYTLDVLLYSPTVLAVGAHPAPMQCTFCVRCSASDAVKTPILPCRTVTKSPVVNCITDDYH